MTEALKVKVTMPVKTEVAAQTQGLVPKSLQVSQQSTKVEPLASQLAQE
jgi:hypothetical protein